MLPELLRFSSRSRLLDSIPASLKDVHYTQSNGVRTDLFALPSKSSTSFSNQGMGFMDAWQETRGEDANEDDENDDENDNDFHALGIDGISDDHLASLGL